MCIRDRCIPLFLMTYRSSVHDTTSMTPAKLVFGWEILLPRYLLLRSHETQFQEPQDYSSQLENQLHEMNHLKRGVKIANENMKMRYDICSNSAGFEEDQVRLYNLKYCCGHSPKLQTNWEGLYSVESKSMMLFMKLKRTFFLP